MKNLDMLDNIDFGPNEVPMHTGKTKSWLGEYHWVSLPKSEKKVIDEFQVVKWCEEHFGQSGSKWNFTKSKFYFKNEKDMSIFILKWS